MHARRQRSRGAGTQGPQHPRASIAFTKIPIPTGSRNFANSPPATASAPATSRSAREVQKLLAATRGKPEEYAIKLALLKSLKRARYATEPLGHYGLAKVNYTHFTSPIRRYADLLVHRALRCCRRGNRSRAWPRSASIATSPRTFPPPSASPPMRRRTPRSSRRWNFSSASSRAGSRTICARSSWTCAATAWSWSCPIVLVTGLIHVVRLPDDFYSSTVRLSFVGRKRAGLQDRRRAQGHRLPRRRLQAADRFPRRVRGGMGRADRAGDCPGDRRLAALSTAARSGVRPGRVVLPQSRVVAVRRGKF